ncbi:uncharacterized protein [Chironomus tepperi]|uniref:uncharacterized protein n=1 Tax=Chironomus tepperi TaxID=113505 RepID=UPI00391FB55D
MSREVLRKHLFVNNQFFENALRDYYQDTTIYLKTFEVRRVSKREESYWADQMIIVANYTSSNNVTKSQNFVLKIGFYNPYMEESVEKYDPFKREIFFFQNILPSMNKMFQSLHSYPVTCNAMCIVNKRPQPKYILLEELSSDKYLRVQRRSGLDQKHLKLTMEKLAKFHACSAVMYQQNSDLFEHHQQPNVSEYFKIFHPLFTACLHKLIEEVSNEKWHNSETLIEQLMYFENNFIDKVSEAFMLEDNELGVLCHGDLWMDNLLFQYDEKNNPIDIKMVDFGLSYFGSPGIDLTYLLFTSSAADIADYEIDVLLQHYHTTLHKTLIKLNFPRQIPSLIQIHNHFMKRGIIGVLYTILLLPMRFSQNDYFKDQEMKDRLIFLLDYFGRKGFLN